MLFDCHAHTLHSHDSAAPVADMCAAAVDAGLTGIAITDHCDCEYAASDHVFERIEGSVKDAIKEKADLADRLSVMRGVELGDALFDPAFADFIVSAFPFDVILGSVHAVRTKKNDAPFSRIDFSDWSKKELDTYLRQYFADVGETLLRFDFDTVSHLTVPFRYINGKYNKGMDVLSYLDPIGEILRETIRVGKVLELNTQGVTANAAPIHPTEEIIDLYLSLGGTEFCLGSDAHTPVGVGNGVCYGAQLLWKKGVKDLYYFSDRKKIRYPNPCGDGE